MARAEKMNNNILYYTDGNPICVKNINGEGFFIKDATTICLIDNEYIENVVHHSKETFISKLLNFLR